MPRSKNPNPRQVMEENGMSGKSHEAQVPEYVGDDAEDGQRDIDLVGVKDSSLLAVDVLSQVDGELLSAKRVDGSSDLISTTTRCISNCDTRDAASSVESSDFPSDGHNIQSGASDFENQTLADLQITPKTSFSFSPSSPPSFFSICPVTSSRSSIQNELNSEDKDDGRKAKCNLPSTLNPNVMTWMKNRFRMGPGGRISASDIIAFYERDTKHLDVQPPGLQNYQVGQLLRRVFPSITRCKITVNGKRHWVYKHLNLAKNPPSDLFEDRKLSNAILKGDTAPVIKEIPEGDSKAPESPVSNFEEVSRCHGTSSPALANVADGELEEEKIKAINDNALLLGLLGKKIKTERNSPPMVSENCFEAYRRDDVLANEEQLSNFLPKKKRDSEVIQWLRENYKIKSGYYVKSMDLLRKYNNGRAEMVKYLSQVGRVMKNVFPSVRHLRKSFKGGKREWVYLNLKPVDVDSDSEEGRSMLMPTMRRSMGWNVNAARTQGDLYRHSGDERPIVSRHGSSTARQPSKTVFKSTPEVFHRISRTDGNKIVIRRSLPSRLPSRSRLSKVIDQGNTKSEIPSRFSNWTESPIGKPPNKKRIIFYNKPDSEHSPAQCGTRVPVELERDIFAQINRAGQRETGPSASPIHGENDYLQERCATNAESTPTGVQLLSIESPCESNSQRADQGVSGLDLTVKRKPPSDRLLDTDDRPDPLNLTLSSGSRTISAVTASCVEAESSPTIHYRPPNERKFVQSTTANGVCPVSASTTLRHSNVNKFLTIKRKYAEADGNIEDTAVSWQSLQSFSAERYGWLRSADTAAVENTGSGQDGKGLRFVEWFLFAGQWLVNKQRAFREIKIYEDWTVVIHALGRRVYPNDLGGITDLEKTAASLNKVFRVLAESKLCMGFPAPSVSDLYIHGILVSKFEVWSSREHGGEDMRQRAVNCQILYSGFGLCCSKCARILKLHQQQGKSQNVKRPI